MSTLRERALRAIITNPGHTSIDVADRLNENTTSVSDALGNLMREGLLARYRDGRCFRYVKASDVEMVTDAPAADSELAEQLEEAQGQLSEREAELAELEKTLAERVVELRNAHARINALMKWRDEAIDKHPDLDPERMLLLRAREIAARVGREDQFADNIIEGILSGDYDHMSMVKGILFGLRETQQ